MRYMIEFAGLPGAGKTTMLGFLEVELERAGIGVDQVVSSSRGRRSAEKALALRDFGATALHFVRGLRLDSRPKSLKIRAFRWMLSTLQEYSISGRDRSASVRCRVLCEGLVQRSILGFLDTETSYSASEHARYLRSCPVPDLIVYFSVPPEQAIARQVARRAANELSGHSKSVPIRDTDRLRWLGSEAERFMSVADSVLRNSADHFAARGSRLLHVDSLGTEETRKQILTVVVPFVLSDIGGGGAA